MSEAAKAVEGELEDAEFTDYGEEAVNTDELAAIKAARGEKNAFVTDNDDDPTGAGKVVDINPFDKDVEDAAPEQELEEKAEGADGESQNEIAPELLEQARGIGLSDETIAKMAESGILEDVLSKVPAETNAPDADDEDDDEAVDSDEPKEEPLPELNEDDGFDPALIKHFNRLHKETKELREQNNALIQALQNQTQFRETLAFDKAVNALPEDLKEFVGSGDTEDLDPKSAPYKNRLTLYEKAVVLSKGYEKTKKTVPPLKKLLAEAGNALWADKLKENAAKKVAEKTAEEARKRQKQGLVRPVNGTPKAKPLSNEQAAVNANRALLRKWGLAK